MELVVGDHGVVDAGESAGGEHGADGAEALASDFGGYLGQEVAQGFYGAFVENAVELAVGVASEPAAGRVVALVVVAGEFEGLGVEVIDVSGAVGDEDGEFG